MKKAIALLLAILTIFSLCACGASKNDEGFIKNLQKGLEARWKISNAGGTFNSNAEYKDHIRNCVNAELKAIGDISEYSFEDAKLAEYAKQYYAALQSQLESVSYYGSDNDQYTLLHTTKGYNVRARLICKFVDDYGLTVSSQYADTLDEFLAKGRLLLKEDKVLEDMQAMLKKDLTLEALGGTNYEILITNTTEYDLSKAWLYFNLYDDKGILVDTVSSYLDSWPSGVKSKATIYSNQQFSKVELMIQYRSEATGTLLATDFAPISYVNNMIIEIKLKTSLPAEFSYSSSSGRLYARCTVSSFSFEVTGWSNGKANVRLYISGKKTYDQKGDGYSRACKVGWKLYDTKGVVVDSGNFFTSDLKVNESFSNTTSYLNNLPVGTYTLELLSVG